jgi:hypothetical protein
MKTSICFHSLCISGVFLTLACTAPNSGAQTNLITVANPDWLIILNDYGYSDLALDQRAGFVGREYLSGEWAAAVSYVRNSVTLGPTWLTPQFIYPDWDSNSDFGVETPGAPTGTTNSNGFPIYRSVITNASFRIGIKSEMIDTSNGIPQGLAPRSAPTGSNLMSDRYVFRQTFGITNRSGDTLTSVKFFKFVHSLEATSAVYDDRAYAGTLNGHRYDITQRGVSVSVQFPSLAPALHNDVVVQHANLTPDTWEVGYYGIDPIDDHSLGKPSEGVHLSVEADNLSGLDNFFPTEKWVSGAVRQTIGTLAPNAFTNLEYLMSVRTESSPIRLKISRAGTNVLLSWPAVADTFFIEEATNVTSTNWEYIFDFPDIQGTNNVLTVPVQPGSHFYRLVVF